MTNEQILKQAIEKAVNNGWGNGSFHSSDSRYLVISLNYRKFIYQHDFTKAFWGEDHTIVKVQNSQIYCQTCSQQVYEGMPMQGEWQHHLQQMVLEENPLKYLEKFL